MNKIVSLTVKSWIQDVCDGVLGNQGVCDSLLGNQGVRDALLGNQGVPEWRIIK